MLKEGVIPLFSAIKLKIEVVGYDQTERSVSAPTRPAGDSLATRRRRADP